uniref:Uncharacterized protein n=1 Tax=Acrobeloides nanus TaxID=290746 RepID=A0A914BZ64_9BILA
MQQDPTGQNPIPISHVVILPCQCNGLYGNGLYQFISPAEFRHRRRMAYITVLIFVFVAIACIIFFFKVHATIEQSYEEAVKGLEKNWSN